MNAILKIKSILFNLSLPIDYKRISVSESIDRSVIPLHLSIRISKFKLFNYLFKFKCIYFYKILAIIIFSVISFAKGILNIKLNNIIVYKRSSN